jgi:hypothetical protein
MVTVRAMLTLMALTFLSCVALAQDENGLLHCSLNIAVRWSTV